METMRHVLTQCNATGGNAQLGRSIPGVTGKYTVRKSIGEKHTGESPTETPAIERYLTEEELLKVSSSGVGAAVGARVALQDLLVKGVFTKPG